MHRQGAEPDEVTEGQLEDSQVSTSLSDVVVSTSTANSPKKSLEVATSGRDESGRSTPEATQEDFVDKSDLSVLADVLDGASNYDEGSMSPERVRALDKLVSQIGLEGGGSARLTDLRSDGDSLT